MPDRRGRVAIFSLSPQPPHLCVLDFADNLIADSIERGYHDVAGKPFRTADNDASPGIIEPLFRRSPGEPRFRKELGEPVFIDLSAATSIAPPQSPPPRASRRLALHAMIERVALDRFAAGLDDQAANLLDRQHLGRRRPPAS